MMAEDDRKKINELENTVRSLEAELKRAQQENVSMSKRILTFLLLAGFFISTIVVSYTFGKQEVRSISSKTLPSPTPTNAPPSASSGKADIEIKLATLEAKIDGLEKSIDRLEHNVELAGNYSANASNTASYTITAVGIFVIVVTLIAGYGAQRISERQLQAALTAHQAELRRLEGELNGKISEALAPLKETQIRVEEGQVDLRRNLEDFKGREKEIEAKFEKKFTEQEGRLLNELEDLIALKGKVEELRDYQEAHFEPAEKIKNEIQNSFEPSSRIKQDIITLLLQDPSLNTELRRILVNHLRQLSDLLTVPSVNLVATQSDPSTINSVAENAEEEK